MFTRTVSTKVSVPISTKYLDEFFRSKCAPDVLPYFQCDNPTKEITESMSALVHARKILGYESSMRKDVICLIPGDGVLPRTGALVAHKTKWNVVSVDPLSRIIDFTTMQQKQRINRLRVYQNRIGELIDNVNWYSKICVILLVHSHAPLIHAIQILHPSEQLIIVSIPCCKKDRLDSFASSSVNDPAIYSDKNTVLTWNIKVDNLEHPMQDLITWGVKGEEK